MARFDLYRHWFRTPNGIPTVAFCREGTNDQNTLTSCLTEDEYGLKDRKVSGIALDIGGHIGGVTLALLIDNPDLRVITVEPIPENADLLEYNAQKNEVADRLTLHQGAVGKRGEVIDIHYAYRGDENALHHAFIGNSALAGGDAEHLTASYTALGMDDLTTDDVAWCKVDIEGGEYAFLADPGVSRLAFITGEWHNVVPDGSIGTPRRITELLGATHDVTFHGQMQGPGGFTAVRR